ncbi:MAG: KEOPS complex kinase/ATPase Bud32 [Thermoplasmatota archaeon]
MKENDEYTEIFLPKKKELLSKGAEAEIWRGYWFDKEVVVKIRVSKGYRHPYLDHKIRKERIRKECKLIQYSRNIGVPVPILYDIDEVNTTIVMQYFNGKRVLDHINNGHKLDMALVGKIIGKLHDAKITHGDLTTSNILYSLEKDNFCFIDFSLGERPSSIEDMGVDLHLLREALISVHENPFELYEEILYGYRKTNTNADEAIIKVKDIESRGRYL